ncbi:MAG: amidase family protein [Ignavibacteriota bacterium]
MAEILTFSAREQARLVRERKISSRELVTAHLEQIAAVNPTLNAVVEVLAERSLDEATAADRELAGGRLRGPLHGVPFSIKDSIESSGYAVVLRVPGDAGRRPPSTDDATSVARLRAGGRNPDRAHQSAGSPVRLREREPHLRADEQSIRHDPDVWRIEWR